MLARRRDDREGDRRQESAEPAVADVIRQRHRRVADARREHLDEHRRDRAVHHRHVDDEDPEQEQHHRLVDARRVGLRRIASPRRAPRRALRRTPLPASSASGAAASYDAMSLRRPRIRHVRRHRRRAASFAYGTPRFTSAAFATSHGDVNFDFPTGSNCTEQSAGSATTVTGAALLRRLERRVRVVRDRRGRSGSTSAPRAAARAMMIGLRPIRSDSAPKTRKNGVAEQQRRRDEQVRRLRIDLQRLRQEEQRVELPRVPHHGLPRREPEQREQHDLAGCPSSANDSVSGAFDALPSAFISWNSGDSLSLSRIHTDTASSTSETRNGMRQPHASNRSVPSADAGSRGSRAARGRARASPSSGSTTCTRRAFRAAHARPRTSRRRRTRRRARAPAAGAAG